MKKGFLALSAFLSLTMAQSASAIYIEPYLGFIMSSDMEVTVPSFPAANSTADVSGNGLGLRLGWGMMGFSFGVDYMMGTIKTEEAGVKEDGKLTNLGLFADYDLPVLPFRFYAAYILDSKVDNDTSDDLKGSGMKIGVGFTMLPFVVINLDHSTLKYDESTPAPAYPFEANVKVTMLSVSLPLNL